MNLYERYEKLRDLKGFTDYKVAKLAGIKGTATISNWKNGKYTPKEDKLRPIANVLDVTYDFLMGSTDLVVCPVCGFGDNPLSEQSRKEHEKFHKRFLSIKDKYPFFMVFSEANKAKENGIEDFRNPYKPIDERMEAFDNCLKAEFSLEILRRNYCVENLNYEDFCKVEVGTLEVDWVVSEEILDLIIKKYGVDKKYMQGNEQLLSRVSNNEQLMRILRYAERLSPEILNSIEIQMKALSENNQG